MPPPAPAARALFTGTSSWRRRDRSERRSCGYRTLIVKRFRPSIVTPTVVPPMAASTIRFTSPTVSP